MDKLLTVAEVAELMIGLAALLYVWACAREVRASRPAAAAGARATRSAA